MLNASMSLFMSMNDHDVAAQTMPFRGEISCCSMVDGTMTADPCMSRLQSAVAEAPSKVRVVWCTRVGSGTAWLFPFVNGAPPVGWEDASKYLVLPVLLVAAQFASSAIISPPIKEDDENAGFTKALFVFLPFMVGWFALNVPSGLSLYYFSNTIITSGIQIWLRKLGGASLVQAAS
jgi:membrane protein insertase Oxa1/YidC/SpoIIIJ